MSNVWALDLNIEFHKTIKQQWLFGTDGVQPTRVADLPSLRDSNSPNQTKGRRMRAAMALEPKSHCDSSIPITGVAQSRVSVSLGCQSCADAESDHQDDTHFAPGPRIERVSVEIGKVQAPEGDMEKDSLQGSVVIDLAI